MEPVKKLHHEIRLHEIIGRRAFNYRNNLKADRHGRVVYHTGQAVVISSVDTGAK